jgi:hypothetical protein
MAKNFVETQVDFVKSVKFEKLNNNQKIGILGAIILLIGTFLPIVSLPLSGSYSLISGTGIAGYLILVSSIVSGYLFLFPKNKQIVWSNLVAAVLTLYALITNYLTIAKYQSDIQSQVNQLKNNPFGSYYSSSLLNAFGSMDINWFGWIVSLVGIATIFYAVKSDLMVFSKEVQSKISATASKASDEVKSEVKEMKEEAKKEDKKEAEVKTEEVKE